MALDPSTIRSPEFRHARLGAGLLAILALVALTTSDSARAATVVRKISGTVEVGRGEPPVWGPLAVGDEVAANGRIRTGGDGRVELAVDAGILRVHENSLLRIPPADPATDRVELESGHSLFDVLRREGRSFEVRTPKVVVSVKGTRFGVEAGAEAGVVSVYRGVVGVRPAEGTEAVETLVREGFLATGGGELPIELDVTPEGDPWSTWENLQSGAWPTPNDRPVDSELERARSTLRRTTDGDVVKRAAERRPEIADRLRQRSAETKGEAARSDDGPRDTPPAAPDSTDLPTKLEGDPTGEDQARPPRLDILLEGPRDGDTLSVDPKDSQRDVLDSTRGREALVELSTSVDVEDITDGALFPNGRTTPNYLELEGFEAGLIVQLSETMEAMRDASVASARPWTADDVSTYLENDLVQQGVDPAVAARMVERLFGH